KMPASCPSVGAWFSQLLICPMTTLSVSSAEAEPALNASGTMTLSAPTKLLRDLMRFLHRSLCCFVAPMVPAFNTGSSPRESPICQRRRFLAARLVLVFVRAGLALILAAFAGRGAVARSLFATRIDQYSHDRVRPVVLALIWPARFVSPGESVAMSEPIVMART